MPQHVTIRNGKINDKPLIEKFGDLDPKWTLDAGLIDLAFSDTNFRIYIAETPGEPVGYGLMRIESDQSSDVMIYVIYVPKHVRRQGVGIALMKHMLDVASNSNCKMVRLMVDVDNTSACTLYKSLGFTDRRVEMHLKLEHE